MALRVALVLADSTGGIGRHVLALARALVERGDGVHVYAPARTLQRLPFAATGAECTALEIPGTPNARDVGIIGELRRALRTASVDVVHAHGLRAGLIATLARQVGVPLAVTWHTTFVAGGLRGVTNRALAVAVARAADLTLCASTELVRQAEGLGARKAWLCPAAAPALPVAARTRAEVLDELGIARDRPVILSVGRLHTPKRHDVLIAAAAAWRTRRPPPIVLLAGVGPAYRDLVGQAAMTRAPVVFLGHRDDVADLLAAADLAVVTSDIEVSPLFVQEVLAAGVPLVATAVSGIVDLVGDGAVLVPPDDAGAVDVAVCTLLDDPGRRAAVGLAGRGVAALWPTEHESVNKVIAGYEELAGVVRP